MTPTPPQAGERAEAWLPIERLGPYNLLNCDQALVARFTSHYDEDGNPYFIHRYSCVAYRFSDGWALSLEGATIGGTGYIALRQPPTHYRPLPPALDSGGAGEVGGE